MPSPTAIIVQGDAAGTPLPISGSISAAPATGPLTDRSGSITTGGVAQTLAAANAIRKYFFIENTSAGDLWINFTTTAVANQPSIKIPAGGSFVMEANFISNELISIFGATTAQAFTAKEG